REIERCSIAGMKLWICVAVMGALCGCSSFNREWKTAVKAPVPANSIEGAWKGEWRSDKNGHHGELRCVIRRDQDVIIDPPTAARYRAHFRARYWKVLRFTYSATLEGMKTNSVVELQGETDLGKLAGGVYRY